MKTLQHPNYALIGVAGYIAPRHLKAMSDTNGQLIAAYDINDSVGIMDSHFPRAAFFTEFEQFSSHMSSLRSTDNYVDLLSICSPNYLHHSHIGYGLRAGMDVICEKPLVLNLEHLDELKKIEVETGQRVNSILQLRLHKAILDLKAEVAAGPADKVYDVDLSYFTSRGAWYHASWKGFTHKSGGIAANIGVHFFDMLNFVFGPLRMSAVHHRGEDSAAGYLEFKQARVRWVLSINSEHLPSHTPKGQRTYRSISVNGNEVEFSDGFTELHSDSYKQIIAGHGFGLDVVRPSIELVSSIRTAPIDPKIGEAHFLLSQVQG